MVSRQIQGKLNRYWRKIAEQWRLIKATLFKVAAILLCFLLGYMLWLDYRIHREFEGSKWTVPARVYSKPHDIFVGLNLSGAEFEQILQHNNYEESTSLTGPGIYTRYSNQITVYSRQFDYWDGTDQARQYRITFQNGAISRIQEINTSDDVALFRIEPILIGKIYPDHNEDRVLVSLEDVPDVLLNALISVEDRSFYNHYGIDLKGILRAFWVNLSQLELAQGGSTLTQQLVKNFFLTDKRTISRKLNEMIMALLIEWRYEKEQILSAYLNEIHLGQYGSRAIHGFGTASEFYFNKPPQELSIDQLALLVGLVKGASYYNPRRSPQRALERRNLVLKQMLEQQILNETQYSALSVRPLGVSDTAVNSELRFHAFLDLAKRQLLSDYELEDLKNDGLRIFTTLDSRYQSIQDNSVFRQLDSLERQFDLEASSLEAASILINPINGEVLAVNGGRDIALTGFNRALDARRPIGSLIKPFIYLTALSNASAYSLLSVLQDEKIKMSRVDGAQWIPDNYDKLEHGRITLLEAMTRSYNLATVRLGLDIGIENIIANLYRTGIQRAIHDYPSLLLGALDLTPLEVTQMYQTLANGGYQVQLNSIREVLNKEGKPLQRRTLSINKAYDDEAVYLTNYALTRVVDMGTARQLSTLFGRPVNLAAKTGTTNESRDSWFAGFSDDLLAVTWLGRDDNQPTPYSGASGAMRIWAAFMSELPPTSIKLVAPQDIAILDEVSVEYDGTCIQLLSVPYIAGHLPENELECAMKDNDIQSPLEFFKWLQ
jgi:penicillin-binding protein 1B